MIRLWPENGLFDNVYHLAVYGAGQVPLRGETVPSLEDPYGIDKYAGELDLRAAQRLC